MPENPRSVTRRVLSLAVVSGLGLAAAPAAYAASADAAAGLGATQLYPLAHTPLDVLSNNLHVPAGIADVSTVPVTAPFQDGLPLNEVPVVEELLR